MLELQKFMQEHDNWADLLAAEPYNLKISYYEKLVMFKYNQLTADFSIPLVREALVLSLSASLLIVWCVGLLRSSLTTVKSMLPRLVGLLLQFRKKLMVA